MSEEAITAQLRPSVFYAESTVCCTLEDAWRTMLHYKSWNPDFARAETALIRGEPGCEGEVTLITILGGDGAPVSQFYAETIKIVAPHHIVWYVFPKEGDEFRNFVDFSLEKTPTGVMFRIFYYAQCPLSGQALGQYRAIMEASLRSLSGAFKSYCDSKLPPGSQA